MTRAVPIFAMIAAWAIPGPAGAMPLVRQVIEDPWKVCQTQALHQETALGLPRHVLTAIGKTESGRWVEANRANVAWPWTVTAEGEGRYFDSAAEALAEVRRLRARRITNIDVGCMQVNLGYHGHHFASLEEAMDPVANTAYAARFLKTLRETSADWMEAAGRYHSSLAVKNTPYRAKIARYWDETKKDEAKRPQAYAVATAPAAPSSLGTGPRVSNSRVLTTSANSITRPSAVPIDHERTAQLNANFRAARERQAGGSGGTVAAGKVMAVGMQTPVMPVGMQTPVDAAANRARIETDRLRAINVRDSQPGTPAAANKFAAKRASDLNRWRATRPVPEPS